MEQVQTGGEFADKLLRTALDVGEHLLLCGADIHRVEDTISRICRAYGAEHVEAFCVTSVIITSVRMPDGGYSSQMRRIYSSTNNLASLEELNHISREICSGRLPLEEADEKIKRAKNADPYPSVVYYLAAMIGASAFCYLYGGAARDLLAAAVAGIPVIYINRRRPKDINLMIQTAIEAFIGGVAANLTVIIGLGTNIDLIRIGVIMLMVPGLAFGSAMQDLLGGDIIAGSSKLVQAVLLAVMIALGLAFSMLLFGGYV